MLPNLADLVLALAPAILPDGAARDIVRFQIFERAAVARPVEDAPGADEPAGRES